VGALVCFESLIAGSVRETVNQGAGLIAVPSNDAYLESPWIKIMHFSQNFLRAAESGRVVLQAATNGVTGAADINGAYLTAETNNGRVRAVLPIEQEGVLLMQVPIYDHVTPYAVIGDLWLAGLVMAVIVIWAVWRRRGRGNSVSKVGA
jgi:apolipoprotein N-acyltransferase